MIVRNIALVFVLAFIAACAHQSFSHGENENSAPVEQVAASEPARIQSEYIAKMEAQLPLIEAMAKLGARDQWVRQSLSRSHDISQLSPEEEAALNAARASYMAEIDEANTRELKALLEDITWRDLANAGGDLYLKAFFVVQHSPDHEFQARVLDDLKPLLSEGLIDSQQYAYLFDRVKLHRDELQLYGTQLICVDGEYDVTDLQTPESVDQRRLEMGLQPLDEYIEFVREHSGSCSA